MLALLDRGRRYRPSLRRDWPALLAVIAAAIHAGTAALRLDAFFPTIRLIDFASFYAGAWALRLGEPTYVWSPELRAFLDAQIGTPFDVPYSFPLWLWLLQPLTYLPYSVAAWLWLGLNLAMLVWATRELCLLAQIHARQAFLPALAVVVLFGPVFLTLTIGQTSVWLLALALWGGRHLRTANGPRGDALAVFLWIGALVSKLFPLIWFGALLLLARWRALGVALTATLLMVALHALLLPSLTRDYLTVFLTERATELSTYPGVNDQSLTAFLLRLTQPLEMDAPGVDVNVRTRAGWSAAWEVDPATVQVMAAGLVVLLGALLVWWVWRNRRQDAEALFYLWVLFSLVVMPHTERYNHTLLLPGMAWLWGRGHVGQRYAIVAYFLSALARLTYLWLRVLPAPWGPLLVGSGFAAVVVAAIGIMVCLRTSLASGSSYNPGSRTIAAQVESPSA